MTLFLACWHCLSDILNCFKKHLAIVSSCFLRSGTQKKNWTPTFVSTQFFRGIAASALCLFNRYDANPAKFQGFLLKCSLYFTNQTKACWHKKMAIVIYWELLNEQGLSWNACVQKSHINLFISLFNAVRWSSSRWKSGKWEAPMPYASTPLLCSLIEGSLYTLFRKGLWEDEQEELWLIKLTNSQWMSSSKTGQPVGEKCM